MQIQEPKFSGLKAKYILLFLVFWGLSRALPAQVQSRSYQFLLRNLLHHTVPELNVPYVSKHLSAFPVFIDAREWNEYAVSHVKNAIWVGYKDFDLSRLEGIDHNCPIVVYCSVGYRSEKIAEKLIAAGFSKASNLYGGIFEWINCKQAVVDLKGEPTELVHAYNRLWGTWVRVKKKRKVYK